MESWRENNKLLRENTADFKYAVNYGDPYNEYGALSIIRVTGDKIHCVGVADYNVDGDGKWDDHFFYKTLKDNQAILELDRDVLRDALEIHDLKGLIKRSSYSSDWFFVSSVEELDDLIPKLKKDFEEEYNEI